MEELFILDSESKKINVYLDDKLIKIIDDVRIGLNGVCDYNDMVEGGKRTPRGLYNLGVAFGRYDLNINYPYIKIDNGSYWVDDINSKYYNSFVEVDGSVDTFGYDYIFNLNKKEFNSAEHLIDYKKAYEYGVFIEYNTDNKINGLGNNKGSAIFLHCYGESDYTYGCVAISRDDMKWVINFLDRNKNPQILIK
ncbi:MAG: L,D-transpeptidase family protein [Bacilli bacterium]|nr:L,D-transpeptidase family protein [Bacilli bacterium]